MDLTSSRLKFWLSVVVLRLFAVGFVLIRCHSPILSSLKLSGHSSKSPSLYLWEMGEVFIIRQDECVEEGLEKCDDYGVQD